jgi:hypothetical protein
LTSTRTRAGLAAAAAMGLSGVALLALAGGEGTAPELATAQTTSTPAASAAPRAPGKVISNVQTFTEAASRPERFINVRGLGHFEVGCPGGRPAVAFKAARRTPTVTASVSVAGGAARARMVDPGERFAPPLGARRQALQQSWLVASFSKGSVESTQATIVVHPLEAGNCIGSAQATILRRQRQDSFAVGG